MLTGTLLAAVLFSSTIAGFDRILLPMHQGNTQGSAGSVWRVDEVIYNQSDDPARVYPVFPLTSFEAQTWTLSPFGRLPAADLDQPHPCRICPPPPHPGAILYVESGHSDQFVMYDRVYEANTDADNHGAVVPAVHENHFRIGRTSFPTVPIDGHLRSTLRLYSLDDDPRTVSVRLFEHTSSIAVTLVAESFIVIPAASEIVQSGPYRVALRPGYVQVAIESLLGNRSSKAVDIVIDGEPTMKYWTFLSVTSNSAQRVTVFLPSP